MFVRLAIFVALFALALRFIIDPAAAVRMWDRSKLPENLLTGRVFYSTPKRARVTASLVALLALVGIIDAIMEFIESY